jgi:hypothetical protein
MRSSVTVHVSPQTATFWREHGWWHRLIVLLVKSMTYDQWSAATGPKFTGLYEAYRQWF